MLISVSGFKTAIWCADIIKPASQLYDCITECIFRFPVNHIKYIITGYTDKSGC